MKVHSEISPLGNAQIRVVPDISDGFKKLRLQCLELDIQERTRVSWAKLNKQITLRYNQERAELAQTLSRAEWLARG